MTITKSQNYYTDFLNSKTTCEFLLDFQKNALEAKVDEIFENYYRVNEECEVELGKTIDKVEIHRLHFKQNENESRFSRQMELIDELFCLHIYKTHVDQRITEDTLKKLHDKILKDLDDIEHAKQQDDFDPLRQRLFLWRQNTSGSTYTSYPPRTSKEETKLDRCIAKAKHSAQHIEDLSKSHERTVNDVFFLYKERSFHGIRFQSLKPVAVIKGCQKNHPEYEMRQATPWMEVIAYESAAILGLADFFTPTTLTTIETQKYKYEGCIQPFIKGNRLDSVANSEADPLPDTSIIKGLIASMIMGLSDAHEENIFINYDDEVQYFDCSRSLPHSNEVIKRSGGYLLPTFRNDLIAYEVVFKPFTVAEEQCINDLTVTARKNLNELREYLAASLTEHPLPEHWLTPDLVVATLDQRLSVIEKEMKNCCCMLDLIFAVNPYYKFYISMRLACQYYQKEMRLFIYTPTRERYPNFELMSDLFTTLSNKRHHSFDALIKKCRFSSINPKEIWKICQERASWGDWLLDTLDYVDTVLDQYYHDVVPAKDEKEQLIQDANSVMDNLQSAAKPDFKDPETKS